MEVPLACSYVSHLGKTFNVSTADRETSAALAPGFMYAETLVWEWDVAKAQRGKLVWSGEGPRGTIKAHLAVCQRISETGDPDEQNAD